MGRFHYIGDTDSLEQPHFEFIDEVLEKREFKGPDVLIEKVGAVADNYVANVKRVVITENGKTFKMVAKIAPTAQAIRGMGNTEMFFYNEHVIYTEILPKFRELQKEAGVPEEEWFRFAECYGSNRQLPYEIILLEDLKEDNYEMLDRFKPLSVDCVKAVLKDLAIYHSLSHVLRHQEPELFRSLKSKLSNMMTGELGQREENKIFFTQLENNALQLLQDEKYKKFVRGTLSDLQRISKEIETGDLDSKYSVIIQGDGWTNNILFQMEGDAPKRCVLIDYQISREGSPAYDIMYMIFNSTRHEQRHKHFNEFLDYYHDEMAKSLKKYDLDVDSVYPRAQLDSDLKRYAKFMLGTNFMVYSMIFRSAEDAQKWKETMKNSTIEDFSENPEKQAQAMQVTDKDTILLYKSLMEGLIDSYLEFEIL